MTVKLASISISGRISTHGGGNAGSTIAFTLSGASGKETFAAKARLGGTFKLTRKTRLTGKLSLRARLRLRGRYVGSSASKQLEVSEPGHETPLPHGCGAIPARPLPSGTGEITGAILTVGGPAPGVEHCTAGTVSVTKPSGEVVTTVTVSNTESYAIVVPAGEYVVSATMVGASGAGCFANAGKPVAVSSGGAVDATTYCNIP